MISKVKGDIPFEKIEMENNNEIFVEYLDEDKKCTNAHGRFTAKYRRTTILDENRNIITSKLEENPNYDQEASTLNNKWQRRDIIDNENTLQIIHEGLTLKEIKEKIENNQSYLVILWKPHNSPIPVDLGYHKNTTLSIIDNAQSVGELTFNVINILRTEENIKNSD